MRKATKKTSYAFALFLAVVMLAAPIAAAQSDKFTLGDITIKQEFQPEENETGVLAAATEQEEPQTPAESETVVYEVQKGDSLSKIATAHNTEWKRLYDANGFIADPNIINPGDKIRIPSPDEELTSRELPQPKPAQPRTAPAPAKRLTTNAPAVAGGSVWDALARCESGGNWAINTGNGYYGGLQFLPSTWRAVGGTGLPHQHSREEQIYRAQILQARSGWGQWPACARKLGLL